MGDFQAQYEKLYNYPFPFLQVQAKRQKLLKLLWEKTEGLTKIIAIIPLNELAGDADSRICCWQAENMIRLAKEINPELKIEYRISYNQQIAIFAIGGPLMRYEVVLDIPYGEREQSYSLLYQIDNLVGEDGTMVVFVNNMIYNLEFKVYISAKKDIEKIKNLIAQSNWKSDGQQGYDELFIDAFVSRKYMVGSILAHQCFSDFCETIDSLFAFKSETELRKKGYNLRQQTKSLRIFISYSHKDKDIVYKLVDALEDSGLNVWIDIKSIDVGDSIVKAVTQGIKEHDLGVMFFSRNYLSSRFSQFEAEQLVQEMITQQKKIFPVKLDEVNVDDILHGMQNYKYYDYIEFPQPQQFAEAVKKKIKRIKESMY